MCGITGYWELHAPIENAPAVLAPMMDALEHRGPDGTGTYVDPEHGIAMGHTRLSIIDLNTGDQPIEDHKTGRVLTVNGEFYDYKRIRAELACEGVRFTTKSDSEIALPLYDRHGLGFVEKLRGEFAFAIFDPKAQRLVLVRDRFGIKPLYYRITENAFYYGSEVKAVLAHPNVPKALSRKDALHQMMQVMVPGSTSFEGIHAIKPGHMLIVERKGDRLEAREKRYWDLEFPDASDHDMDADPEPYIDRVRELMIDSVGTRLEADVPVGCYLSGGIDSCSILGLATPMQQSPVKAFTISFDDTAYDEAAIAREMAEMTGADQEVLHLTSDDLYGENFETVVWHAERTFYNTLAVAKWMMSRRVRECGFKVVITGEGSDELFGGYPFFKRDLFLHASDDGEAMEKKLAESNEVFSGAILAESQQRHEAFEDLCGFTPSWIQPWMLTLELVRPLLSESVREELRDYDPIAAIAETLDPKMIRGRHPLDIAQYTWAKTMLEGQILTWGGDRVDMANSMESRPAFLDHHVAEFATKIPPSMRVRDGVEKWVLREAMRGVLPEVLYKREKFAFMAPPSHTDRKKQLAIEALAKKWLDADRLKDASIFDGAAVETYLENAHTSDDPVKTKREDIVLNHLVAVQIMHERLAKGAGAPTATRA